jgi:hypothetical protein
MAMTLPEPSELLFEALARGVSVERAYLLVADYIACFAEQLHADEWHGVRRNLARGEQSYIPIAELAFRCKARGPEPFDEWFFSQEAVRKITGGLGPFEGPALSQETRKRSPFLYFIVDGDLGDIPNAKCVAAHLPKGRKPTRTEVEHAFNVCRRKRLSSAEIPS